MRRARLIQLTCVAGALGAAIALVACADLFHDTSFQTLCDVDASAPGCGATDASAAKDVLVTGDGGADAATDFCAKDSAAARTTAAHACAWLGACEGPYEHNPFGQCVFEAIQAYDCSVRPNMKVNGSIFAYWSCLADVKSCDDVNRCVYAGSNPGCKSLPAGYNSCANNGVTRVGCKAMASVSSHPTFVANCNAQGRRCVQPDPTDSIAFCAASDTSNDAGCSSGCEGAILHDCEDGGLTYAIDVGRDCRNVGAGSCRAGDGGAVCAPSGAACSTGALICSMNVAIDCRSGLEDRVDCAKLASSTTCTTSGATGPAWDPAYACVGPATCGPDVCTGGNTINGCANGIAFSVDCRAVGLSSCVTSAPVPVGPDYDPTEVRAACKP